MRERNIAAADRVPFGIRCFAIRLATALVGAMVLHASAARADVNVDLALVLAVDISYSMDVDEQRLQREGYVKALTSPEVMQAIAQGEFRRIAVSYVEWAGAGEQYMLIDWQVIEGPETADAFVGQLAAAPIRRGYRTSISAALAFAADRFRDFGFAATRQAIDISGDGPNNQGPRVLAVREGVLSRGIVINGLPLMLKRPLPSWFELENLDQYYSECVIGGPGSFMVPVRGVEQFEEAIRMKLVLEIAGLQPAPQRPLLHRVQGAPAIDCEIGEKVWRMRRGTSQ